ncbi:peroxiredoxin [candidate division KSB1 bacterium]
MKAPLFTAKTYEGKSISLKDYTGKKNVVLYFYPKDDTPGCTKEACSFRDNLKRINNKSTIVLGVSVDNVKSHEKFKNKYELNFDLVSDEDHTIVEKYGVKRVRNERVSANRVTFLIDKKGIIRYIWHSVKVDGHVDRVIDKIKELGL